MKRIYLDNAATTPISKTVLQVMLPFLQNNFGNPSSIHAEGRIARAAVEKSRRNIGRLINALPSEIFFTSGGTEANNTVLKNSVRDLGVKRIISSPLEHACVRNSVLSLERDANIEKVYVKTDKYGRADLEDLEKLLSQGTKTLVSLMHSNNEIGTLNDIEKIAQLCQENNALFHTDTVQTYGYYDIDVKKIPVHFLSGSAHKLYGPKGIGFLYINSNVQIKPFIDGGGQERTLRSGTENVAGIVGFGKAAEEAENNKANRVQYILELKKHFISLLNHELSEKVSFNGDFDGLSHCKVLSVNFETDVTADMLMFKLDLAGISVSGGSACSSGAMKASSVISALGVSEKLKTVRFSLSHHNTIEELGQTVKKIKEILK